MNKKEDNKATDLPSLIVKTAAYFVFFMGIFLTCINVTSGRFICERSKNTCELQERHLWENYQKKKSIRLSNITEAYVDKKFSTFEGPNGEGRVVYQVILNTKQIRGAVQLFDNYSGEYDKHAKRAVKINRYLNSQEEYLEIQENMSRLFFALPCTLPLLFIFIRAYFLPKERENNTPKNTKHMKKKGRNARQN